jgi:hypothetical protein
MSTDQARDEIEKAVGEKVADTRTPQQIEDEIVATRARLARSVDELADEANPAVLARRATDTVKDFYVDPETGAARTDRIAKTAAALAGFLLFRRIVRRGS